MSSPLVDLFAKLGLEIDIKGFETADKYIEKLRTQTKSLVDEWDAAHAKMAAASQLAASKYGPGKLRTPGVPGAPGSSRTPSTGDKGDLRAAVDLVSLDVVAAREEIATQKRVQWANVWKKAVIGAVAATGAAFATYRGAQGIAGLVQDTAQAGAHADELSQKLGISAEAVQELGYAAGQSGSNTDGLADGLSKLANTAQNAKNGSKEAAKAFKSVGMSAREVISGKVPLDAALGRIADQFAMMPDGAKKSALAMDLFGKSGHELIPLLNQGSAGIAHMRREAHEVGAVIDARTTKALEGLGDESDKVKLQLAGIRNEAVKAVLPALLELVKGMQAWIKANRADIVKGLVAAMKALIQVMEVVGPVIAATVKALAWFGDHVDFAKALFGSLAFGLGVTLIPLFYVLIKVLKNVGGMFETVGDAAHDTGKAILDAFRSVGSFIEGVADDVRAAFEAVFAWIAERVRWVVERVQWAIEKLGDAERRAKSEGRGFVRRLVDAGTNPLGTAAGALGAPSWVEKGFGYASPSGAFRAGSALISTAAPRGPRLGTGAGVTMDATFNITSTKADPKEVAIEVRSEMDSFWNKQIRIAKAGIA